MKKILSILLVALSVSFASHAQFATVMPLAVGDTIANTGTASKVISATGGYAGAAIQVILTKISGTGAGTVKLMGSNDNSNYTQIGSSFTITDVASQNTVFYVASPLPVYLKVLATGSGTESVVQTVKYVFRKYQLQ
jgi:hypothetical protein